MQGKFHVDIWLIYGSFSYGIEAQVLEVQRDSLGVAPLSQNFEESAGLRELFESVLKAPRNLRRVEARIFSHPLADTVSFPVTLVTERLPSVVVEDGYVQLVRVSGLRGQTPNDESNWIQLLDRTSKSLLF